MNANSAVPWPWAKTAAFFSETDPIEKHSFSLITHSEARPPPKLLYASNYKVNVTFVIHGICFRGHVRRQTKYRILLWNIAYIITMSLCRRHWNSVGHLDPVRELRQRTRYPVSSAIEIHHFHVPYIWHRIDSSCNSSHRLVPKHSTHPSVW